MFPTKNLATLCLCFIAFSTLSISKNKPEQKTSNYHNLSKSLGIKSLTQQAKLLPSPIGIGGNGIELGKSISMDGDRVLIGAPNMDDGGYVYILDYDGKIWSHSATLKLPIQNKEYKFGYSVSLSGNRALIGAYGDDESSGAAYVFDYDGINWVYTHKIVALDRAEDDFFGKSVSLSENRAVIGSSWDDDVIYNSGSAYVFDYDGIHWIQTQKLLANDGERSNYFGSDVSIYDNKIAISSNGYDGELPNQSNIGAVYIFELIGSSWEFSQKLVSSDPIRFQKFGNSISLSKNKILIGTKSDASFIYDFDGINWIETFNLPYKNTVYFGKNYHDSVCIDGDYALIGNYSNLTTNVYKFDGNIWNLENTIIPTDLNQDSSFGLAVAVSGNKISIGASSAIDDFNNLSGAAFFYNHDITDWNEINKFSINEDGSANTYFGGSVSISGNRAIVGASADDGLNKFTGAAYIYDFDGIRWNLSQKITASDAKRDDYFGYSVSLQGNRAVVGAYGVDELGALSGAVYIFDFDGKGWNQTQKLTANDGLHYDVFGKSVSLFDDNIVVGADGSEVLGGGSAYVFSFNGSNWVQTQKLFAQDGTGGEAFGSSVSIHKNKILIGDFLDDDLGHDSGSAYIFDFNGVNWSQMQKLTALDGESADKFGISVSVENDTVVIGASHKDFNDVRLTGSAYVFELINATWHETNQLIPADIKVNDRFGSSVQVSNNNILVGSRLNDEKGKNSGAGYWYKKVNDSWILIQKILASDGGEYDLFGSSVSIYGNKVIIGSNRDNDNGHDSGSAYIYDLDLIFRNGFSDNF